MVSSTLRTILGAWLVQTRDRVAEAQPAVDCPALPDGVKVVTKRQPTAEEWEALRFAWRVCAPVKSNTVAFTDAGHAHAGDRRGADESRRRGERGVHEGRQRREPVA